MHSFWAFFFNFTFFEKFSQVAILKLEHCGLFYLVACGCLHNSLYFESDHLEYFWKKNWKTKIFENLDFGFRKVYGRSTKFSKWETKNTRFCFRINKLSNAKKAQCSTFKIATCENFQSWKKKIFRRVSERWQTIGTASPQTEASSAFFEQHSSSTVKSQCATEQLGPQGLIMDTKYGKKAMIGRNKLWRAMKRCDSRGRTRYYWLTFVPLPDVLPVVVVAW